MMVFCSLFWISLILILHTYFFYYLLMACWARLRPAARKQDPACRPTVSMILSAYNEEAVIGEKIHNCLAIDYPVDNIEFILGSDGSTDRTVEIMREQAGTRANIHIHAFPHREGKAGVLNKIIREATGEILVFSDANTMYDPDSINRLTAPFADEKVGGVCGRLTLLRHNENVSGHGETAYWRYENELKKLEGRARTVFGATGAIYAIRRHLYRELPAQETMINDDFLIPLKVVEQGYDVVYEEKARATEQTSPSLKGEFARKVRIGAGNFHTLGEVGALLRPWKGFIAFGLWSHKVIRWVVPFLLVLLLASNLFCAGTAFYRTFLALQILFYLLALVGWLSSAAGIRLGILVFPYYFVAVNFALLVGFIRFLTGTQKRVWARVER